LIDDSSLLVLVGGGRVPRFAPNKVVLWDEDAAKIVEVKRLEADTSSSEGTASPAASTLFSLSREEAGGEMSNSRDTMSQPSASQTMSRMSVKSTVEETEKDDVDALMQSEMSKAPDIPDDDDAALTTSVEAAKVFVSASMSSSAYVEDPFGAPIAEAKTPEPSPLPSPLPLPLPSRSKPPSRSTDMPPVSHVVSKGREVAELEFGEAVKGVCVRTFAIADGTAKATTTSATLLVVILNTKVVVFELGTHIPLEQKASDANVDKPRRGIRQRIVVEIRPNLPIGLASMALIERSNCVLLALPGRQTGHVQLLSIALSNTSRTSIRSSIAGASTIIAAHANAISSLTLSHDGRLLCTTSERGTLLRVWSTLSASTQDKSVTNLSTSLVGELRRGSDAAKIWSVSFSPDSLLLAAGSDKGTIHFFNLHPLHQVMLPLPTGSQASTNHLSKKANKYLPPSVQQFAGSIPPSLFPQYLKSQWSFAQFKVPLKVFSSSVAEGSRVAPLPLYSLKGQHGAGDEDVESDASSKEVSLEGGWAGMRGRIDDVRKGEKGIEEGMWLTWIPAASAFEQVTTSSSPTKSSRRRSDKASPFELVAITSSGSYYRIGVSAPDQGPMKLPKSATTVLDMYKEDSSSQQSTVGDKGSASPKADQGDQCWLLEYQRFGMRDEWID
jgi:hypothetical protein